jgi:hypothetical protein
LSLLGCICVQCSGTDEEQQVEDGSGVPHLYRVKCASISARFTVRLARVYIGPMED